MDTGKGIFIPAENDTELQKLMKKHPKHGGWFTVGEHITIKGSKFRVKSIKPTEIRLKLLPRSR